MQTSFILMNDLSSFQRRFDLLLHRSERVRAAFDQLPHRPFTHLDEEQVPHHFTGTSQWQQLLFDQIHRRRSHVGSIVDRSLHSGGKCGDGDLLAHRTLFLLRLIFPHPQTRRGHVHDLATLSSTRSHRMQVVLTRFTSLYRQVGDLIGGGRELQARSRVSWLSSRWLPALLAQAFRCAHRPIRGRRQVAIVAIFREPVLQGFQVLAQALHLLTLVLDHGVVLREQRLLLLDQFVPLRQLFPQHLILFSQMLQFFFHRHARTLLALTPFGKPSADLGSYVSRNVCDFVDPPRIVSREATPLTLEQAQALLKSVREHRLETLLTMAVVTGMRRGELLALRWSNIDLSRKTLLVLHTVDYIPKYGYVETEPKTMAGKRLVSLPSFLIDMLKQHRVRQLEQQLKQGEVWEGRDLVFPDLRGEYFNPNYLLRVFKRVLAEAGIPHMHFHDLRHSAATILLSMGVNVKVIQELLGHSDIDITLGLYSHLLPSMQQEVVDRWEDVFGRTDEDHNKA